MERNRETNIKEQAIRETRQEGDVLRIFSKYMEIDQKLRLRALINRMECRQMQKALLHILKGITQRQGSKWHLPVKCVSQYRSELANFFEAALIEGVEKGFMKE